MVSRFEEDSDGYILYIHLLEDEPRTVSKNEIENLLNGGTIRFRGNNWKIANHYTMKYSLKKEYSDENDKESLLLGFNGDNDKEEYTIMENIGRWNKLCDYKSDTLYKLKVDKDVKVGSTFNKFLYNKDTLDVIVTDSNNKILSNSEDEAELFFENLSNLDEPFSSFGECIAYCLNDKVVAIQSFTDGNPQ